MYADDKDVDVRMVRVRQRGKTTVEPSAMESFNFGIERVNTLIQGCKKGDFLFETTCVQAGLILLVSALETYCSKRFVELEAEGWKLDFDSLCSKIYGKYADSRKAEILETSKEEGKSISATLVEGRYVRSFDRWKDAFGKGYGIKFGEIPGTTPQTLEKLRQYKEYRDKKIVHSTEDATILDYDKVPPTYADKKLLEDARDTFLLFVKRFHETAQKVPGK